MFDDGFRYEAATERVALPGSNLTVMAGFTAFIPRDMGEGPHAAELTAEFSQKTEDWTITRFSAVLDPEDGARITTESLREMPVAHLLRLAVNAVLGIVADANGDDYWVRWLKEIETTRAMRADGPTPANLAFAAEVYRVGLILRRSPVMMVTETFGLRERSAAHWIKLAKERGHLLAKDGE